MVGCAEKRPIVAGSPLLSVMRNPVQDDAGDFAEGEQ